MGNIPDMTEIKKLKEAQAKHGVTMLAPAEQYSLVLCQVPEVQERLQALTLMHSFETDLESVNDKLGVLMGAAEQLKTSPSLAAALTMLWKLGNFMNHGSRRGNAYGMRLASFRLLPSLKTKDKKHSLLDTLVVRLQQAHLGSSVADHAKHNKQPLFPCPVGILASDPVLLSELSFVADAARVEKDSLMKDFLEMRSQMKAVQELKQIALARVEMQQKDGSLDPRDRLIGVLDAFLNAHQEEMDQLEEDVKDLTDTLKDLIIWFGEDVSIKWEEFFGLFNAFLVDFKKAHKELLKEATTEHEKKKKEEVVLALKEASKASGKTHQGGGKKTETSGVGGLTAAQKQRILREQMATELVPLEELKSRPRATTVRRWTEVDGKFIQNPIVNKAVILFKEGLLKARAAKAKAVLEKYEDAVEAFERQGKKLGFAELRTLEEYADAVMKADLQVQLSREARGLPPPRQMVITTVPATPREALRARNIQTHARADNNQQVPLTALTVPT
eukprot:gb/GEZN01004283.1/.p1 GENE.gb/GEZN01004283.1/~~gb/GEZN01004283.1/.p1  ORF type:complete len:558 (-),score=146.25 gb/GEZN01004283.1/:320-1828(-)